MALKGSASCIKITELLVWVWLTIHTFISALVQVNSKPGLWQRYSGRLRLRYGSTQEVERVVHSPEGRWLDAPLLIDALYECVYVRVNGKHCTVKHWVVINTRKVLYKYRHTFIIQTPQLKKIMSH